MIARAVSGLTPAADAGLLAALFLSGIVKGVLGIGLPLVSVPLAAQFVDLPVAVALLTMPMLATNIGQALEGGDTLATVQRLFPVLAALATGTVVGAHFLVSANGRTLDLVVGVSFLLLSGVLLSLPHVRIGKRSEPWAGPCVGFAAGLLGGVCAMFGPPLVAYQIGLGVDPDGFVKRMAILALTGTACLLLALGATGALSAGDLALSCLAILPIQLGMPFGRRLRGRVPPILFRAAVLAVLAWAGLSLLRRALI